MGGAGEGTHSAPAATRGRAPAGGRGLRPISAAELLAEELPPLVWVWEPFLPEGGLVVCAAFMKVGKSTLTCALAVAVAQGRPFLGYPTKQRGVLILALEEHARDVQRRLQAFGLRPEDPLWVQRDPVRLASQTLGELEEFVDARGIGLVIIDTLGRFWTVLDENDNAGIERALGPVLDLARRTGACVLLVHHERKGADEQGATGETIRGGSALLGLVDQALLLRRGAPSDERVLVTVGRYAETPRRLRLRFDGRELPAGRLRRPAPGGRAAAPVGGQGHPGVGGAGRRAPERGRARQAHGPVAQAGP